MMTTLNARANQAWREAAGGEPFSNAGFGNERAAFEEGWETGYKAAAIEVLRQAADAWGDGIEGFPYQWLHDRADELAQGASCDECGGDLVRGNHELTCSRLPLGDSMNRSVERSGQ